MNSEQMLDVVEFVGNLQKFEQQLSHCLQQLTGDTRLNVPAITVDDPQAFADEKPDLVLQLEAAVEEWTPAIAAAVQAQEGKTKVGRGPLAEIGALARAQRRPLIALRATQRSKRAPHGGGDRESRLAAAARLPLPVRRVEKVYIEAKDNVKFLTTLERHFKHITNGTLVQVIDTLPSMMNALRMVWVISRHYKEDHRMEPLMGRIAWEIATKVSGLINVRSIFRENSTSAIKLIGEARSALEKWESSYFDMRARIEESGRGTRWEFDKNKLFAKTKYMAQRCGDLLRR